MLTPRISQCGHLISNCLTTDCLGGHMAVILCFTDLLRFFPLFMPVTVSLTLHDVSTNGELLVIFIPIAHFSPRYATALSCVNTAFIPHRSTITVISDTTEVTINTASIIKAIYVSINTFPAYTAADNIR